MLCILGCSSLCSIFPLFFLVHFNSHECINTGFRNRISHHFSGLSFWSSFQHNIAVTFEYPVLILLSTQGFHNWNRRDYLAYLRALERYGRDDVESIGKAVPGKTEEEVRAYHEAFWKNMQKLPGIVIMKKLCGCAYRI